ncbi:hypothetical protein KKB18_05500 [bacterium]|nr:hypothetical protein [bacterium]
MNFKIDIFITIILIIFSLSANAGSIILPFWQDDSTPKYTMFIITNTSSVTSNLVSVMFYGKTGNPQMGAPFIREIPPKNAEIFGTLHYWGTWKLVGFEPFGYALCTETGGKLLAVGIFYDSSSRSGYVLPCFKGKDDGSTTEGW